jgi:hypothetical protein
MDASVRLVCLHGTVVLMAGLLSGLPYWLTIILGKSGEPRRAWRLAHIALTPTGIMMMVIGLLLPVVSLPDHLTAILVWSIVISGYSFVWALVGGAFLKRRALLPSSWGWDTALFVGHALGATGSTIGVALIIYGLLIGESLGS